MTDEIPDLKKLKVARFLCQTDMLFHTRYFFKDQYRRKFVIGDHHKIICDALDRIITGKCKRLIINIAPRYGKTELAVKMFISHALSLNPAAKFIHLSYADDLALDNSLTVRDIVTSQGYQELFPEVQIRKDAKATNKWYTTAGGGVLARAAGGQVTGFGAGAVDEEEVDLDEFINDIAGDRFKFGGAIVIDDAIKPEDADSDTVRVKVNERFESTIRNRVNSRNTPIIVIGQRLHPMDLPGYLQRPDELDKWEVISLPCINANDNTLGLVPGAALWPFKHTIAELKAMKKANEINYERQYNQNPNPKAGLMFPIQELHFFKYNDMLEELADPDASYMPVDPANLGGDDFAALSTKLIGNRIYVPDVIYNTEGADINEGRVVQFVIDEVIKRVGVEAVFGWDKVADRIKEDLEDNHGYEDEFVKLRPRTNKHSRINARSSFIKNHLWFREDYMDLPEYRKFMQNLTSYLKIQEPGKKNKHDEAPDVCEMAASYYERNHAHVDWKKAAADLVTEDE